MPDRARERFSKLQGPRVGLWGRFDLPGLGDLLHPRVFEAEILRRLPGARVLTWSPLGTEHPLAIDGGLAPASLGTAKRERLDQLAAAMDALVIGGGELIATRDTYLASDYGLRDEEATSRGLSRFFLEAVGNRAACPVAWNAAGVPLPFTTEEAPRVRHAVAPVRYLSVPDEASRRHLADAGVEAPITVVPSPLLLSARVASPELLGRRWKGLIRAGAAPAEGPFILIEGGGEPGSALRELLEEVASLVTEKGNAVVVLDDATETDHWSLPVYRIPASASLTDRLAAMARSTCVLSGSAGTLLVASSFGVACGFLDPAGGGFPAILREPGMEELGFEPVTPPCRESLDRLLRRGRRDALPAEIESRLERHFDRLAETVSPATRERGAEVRVESWRKAYEAVSNQVAEQRLRLAERLDAADAALAEASVRSEEAEHARDLLAASVASLETSLAASEESGLRAREEVVALGVRLAGAAEETFRLRASLQAGKRQETFLQEHVLELEKRLALERTARVEAEASSERLAADATRNAAEAARLAHLEAGSRALTTALSSRLRTAEEDAARWRLEADRLLRERTAETEATELARAEWRRATAALATSQRETSRALSEAARIAAELEATRAELVRLDDTRPLRWTEALRSAIAAARRAFPSSGGRRP